VFLPPLSPSARHEAKHQSDEPQKEGNTQQEERLEDIVGGGRIRCPRCGWRPRKADRWSCSCMCSWNTFETFGVCPKCKTQWHNTQCFSCHQWSPHKDWYTPEPSKPS
jgi:hypothetical protein